MIPSTNAPPAAPARVPAVRLRRPVGLVLILGGLLSVAAFLQLRSDERRHLDTELDHRVGAQVSALWATLDRNAEISFGLRNLIYSTTGVDWSRLRETLNDLRARHPGVQALEWVPYVERGKRSGMEENARAEGLANFRFTERDAAGRLVPAGDRAEYYPIRLIEPAKGNEDLPGLDLGMDPVLRPLLEYARDVADMALSGPIQLSLGLSNVVSMTTVAPVYDQGLDPGTAAARRKMIRGFLLAVFRTSEAIESAFSGQPPGLELLILDQSAPAASQFVYFRPAGHHTAPIPVPTAGEMRAGIFKEVPFHLLQRDWLLLFRPTPEWLHARASYFPQAVLLGGLLFSALLAAYLQMTGRRADQVEQLVARRTTELQSANRQLELEITERQQAESTVRLLHHITEEAGAAPGVEAAFTEMLRAVCATTGWALGQVWLPGADGSVLRCAPAWHATRPGFEKFRAVSEQTVFASSEGLPGRVLARREPVWIHDLAHDEGCVRADDALECGLHAALAVPVLAGPELVAVVEFFLVEARVKDERLVRLVATVAAQMGAVIQRKHAEAARHDSEARYRLIFEGSRDAIAYFGPNTTLLSANRQFYDLFGYASAAAFDATQFHRHVHPEDWAHIIALQRRCLAGESVLRTHEFRAYHSDRRLLLVEGSFDAVRAGEVIVGLCGIFRDITERRRAEESLAQERNLLRTLIDSLPDYVYVKDTAGRYLLHNESYRRLRNLRGPEDGIGKTVFDLVPTEEAQIYANDDQAVLQTGEPVLDREEPFTVASGDRGWLLTAKVPLRDPLGHIVGLVGVSRDITVRKREAAERSLMERKLQETQKLESLGVLAGGIAHDFNNLLTGILGNASLARMDLPAGSPVQDYLGQIEEASVRAADLCKQMLAYSGKGRFVVQSLDLSALVVDTTHLLQISISKKAVLKFNLTRNLPAVRADATQMRQIIMNLVINASDAIGDQSGIISLNTGVLRADRAYLSSTHLAPDLPEGDYVFLEVSDNGCGMDAGTLTRIFDPFFTTKFTGRGLGLAAVLGIVRGHKGALKVYSEVKRGSTFKLLLPCAEGPTEEFKARVAAPDAWRGHGTVLVIDDEETVRAVTARMLESFGFQVRLAADGRSGVALFREHAGSFRAVLLDLTMPHMDGEAAFRELRQAQADCRVLLMSGFNEQDAVNRFVGKGLAGFLQKPFHPEALREKLREILG